MGKYGAFMAKTMFLCGLLIYIIYIVVLNNPNIPSTEFLFPFKFATPSSKPNLTTEATNVNHLMFGILGSVGAWKHRKAYTESWWRPNVTYGYLYLDTAPTEDLLPWPSSSPPFRVSQDISRLLEECKHAAPVMARMVHGIMEVMKEKREGLRWLIMGDDDSVFFVDNFVDVLSTYDHTKYIYIGEHSEFVLANYYLSFDNGFGGAGFVLSYPLAEALVIDLEGCLKRYHYLKSADHITMTCIADIGVDLTQNKGIHQIDLRGDISGFLSGHPQLPILSLHHLDMVEPLFPSLNRFESANHLIKVAASLDQSRMLQQTICYDKQKNWSLAISWGYSSHIYESIIPRSILKKPLETFSPWFAASRPYYMFDTRLPSNNPCESPHVFFFQSIKQQEMGHDGNQTITTYTRSKLRGLPSCLSAGNHSADYISTIQVISPSTKLPKIGRSECCDILNMEDGTDTAQIKYRPCMIEELIA